MAAATAAAQSGRLKSACNVARCIILDNRANNPQPTIVPLYDGQKKKKGKGKITSSTEG